MCNINCLAMHSESLCQARVWWLQECSLLNGRVKCLQGWLTSIQIGQVTDAEADVAVAVAADKAGCRAASLPAADSIAGGVLRVAASAVGAGDSGMAMVGTDEAGFWLVIDIDSMSAAYSASSSSSTAISAEPADRWCMPGE
jgi:hypothetical protein